MVADVLPTGEGPADSRVDSVVSRLARPSF